MINHPENGRDDRCFRNSGEGDICFFKLGRADTMGVIVPFQRGLVGLWSQGALVWGTHAGGNLGGESYF